MIKINLTVEGPNADRAGTREDPFTSGYFQLHIRPAGETNQAIYSTYEHAWVVGGLPVYSNAVEPWFGREGHNPYFGAAPKKVLSKLRLTAVCWYGDEDDKDKPGSGTVRESKEFWVMAFEDEPTPTWWIYCTDGRVIVVNYQRKWLLDRRYIYAPPWDYARIRFRNANGVDGTVLELETLLAAIPDPDVPPDPPGPSEPEPLPFTVGETVVLKDISFRVTAVSETELKLKKI